MSEYYEHDEEFDEIDEQCALSEDDILAIQEEYRRKKLIDSLIGPVTSTIFHIGLIIILAFLITDKYKEEVPEIEVVVQEIEEVQIEEPPPIEEPEPEEVEEETVNPVLTTVALENIETNDAALEDVSDEAPSTEDDSSIDAISDVVISPSAFSSPNVFGGRSAAVVLQQWLNLVAPKPVRLIYSKLFGGWRKYRTRMAPGEKEMVMLRR